jgi:hypothetical protein
MPESPISEEEVWNIIKHLPSDKAPGPDGLTERFYKSCWQIIKGDIMAAVSALWRRDFRNFRLLNTTFITLRLPGWIPWCPRTKVFLSRRDSYKITLCW